MSLRRAAERVDDQMRSYMQTRAISGPWAAGEGLLVCISPSPLAEKLIRTTRGWQMNSTPNGLPSMWRSPRSLRIIPPIANASGAPCNWRRNWEPNPSPWQDVPSKRAVLEYARKNNITKVVVGKPLKPRWQELWSGSIVDQLIYASGDIDVYVISARDGTEPSS